MQQKLQDSYGRTHNYLRLSITDRCNLKCSYCMPVNPFFRPSNNLLTIDEIDLLCDVFVSMGINKIRITGGEPLARKDFPEIVNRISKYNIPLYLTTNGMMLHRYIDLISDKFMSVNISLDTLQNERFVSITRHNAFTKVVQNINLLLSNNIPLKLNMVLLRGINHDEIPDFIKLTLDYPVEVRFIEFMPFRDNAWELTKSYTRGEIIKQITSKYSIERLENDASKTANLFRVKNAPGRFGIIATVSHPFCEYCNRLRVTADGKFKNCLFDTKEYDLRAFIPVREKLKEIIHKAVQKKKFQHGGNNPIIQTGESDEYAMNRSMTAIGG